MEPSAGKICVGSPDGSGACDGDALAADEAATVNVVVAWSGFVSVADELEVDVVGATMSEVSERNVNCESIDGVLVTCDVVSDVNVVEEVTVGKLTTVPFDVVVVALPEEIVVVVPFPDIVVVSPPLVMVLLSDTVVEPVSMVVVVLDPSVVVVPFPGAVVMVELFIYACETHIQVHVLSYSEHTYRQ